MAVDDDEEKEEEEEEEEEKEEEEVDDDMFDMHGGEGVHLVGFFDGACKNNGVGTLTDPNALSVTAWGALLCRSDGEELWRGHGPAGTDPSRATVTDGEVEGMYQLLSKAAELGCTTLQMRGDSTAAINAYNGDSTLSGRHGDRVGAARSLLDPEKVTAEHVPRAQNTIADAEANLGTAGVLETLKEQEDPRLSVFTPGGSYMLLVAGSKSAKVAGAAYAILGPDGEVAQEIVPVDVSTQCVSANHAQHLAVSAAVGDITKILSEAVGEVSLRIVTNNGLLATHYAQDVADGRTKKFKEHLMEEVEYTQKTLADAGVAFEVVVVNAGDDNYQIFEEVKSAAKQAPFLEDASDDDGEGAEHQ